MKETQEMRCAYCGHGDRLDRGTVRAQDDGQARHYGCQEAHEAAEARIAQRKARTAAREGEMTYKLINPEEFEPGMVTTGVELANGQIAKFGRWRIEYVGFAGVDATCLHNGARRTFRPDATTRYEVEEAA